ncbi:hypothetical protein NZNM25_05680 [Nitrosopumilus zosterae]|uniref:Uncharacterized protein n=1 Tax=Nitrosopumilus zosterae TaxID=718286 RepID=A0A2S2KQE5_9ARCH|nr:hypothetical protein [Nitrosopumilus zosterae]BDQ31570.1 hypothetical protein NZOSNM25_001692 [Nitrosopumilus zosterae]GBH33777.1 hypothetical protein NZNM25_05680 [Nitrosopumilus zosterae]
MLLFLISLILLPAFGATIPDYDNPYSPIFTDKSSYTWTDKVKMTIIAPSWNTDNDLIDSIGDTKDHPIKISTREHSLEPYKFTETDVNSGIFTAEVILTGFFHDADGDGDFDTNPRTMGNGPTSGFLEVERDSAITISFEFADGVVLTESAPVTWNVGTIQFMQEIFLTTDSVNIRMVDPDMNLNPEALDHIPIQVISDSDVAGIEVDGIETSESSGMFVATVSLTQSSTSGNRLYAIPGDKISAKYDDYTLPKPYSISDNLSLQTFAIVDSAVPPIERIDHLSITFSDSLGNPLQSFTENHQIQIVGTIANPNEFDQKFVYLFQVKNEQNIVESISWVQGELSSAQSLDVSQSWTPKTSGNYKIETFVWNSIAEPTGLAPIMSTLITVE